MQKMADDCKRVLAGKEVLGVLAGLLIVSGMTTASLFIDASGVFAATVAGVAPAAAGVSEALVLGGLYLQAVVIAAVYRVARGVYATLQRRRERVLSSA